VPGAGHDLLAKSGGHELTEKIAQEFTKFLAKFVNRS